MLLGKVRVGLSSHHVGGPFSKDGVDVLRLPLTLDGNQYTHWYSSTKWVEVVAIPDQKAETIARMFVEYVVCRHGAPHELQVCKLFDVQKLNTTGCHPQTNGLCERFNSTLIHMLAKTVEKGICRMFCMLTVCRYRSLLGSRLSFCFTVETQC